MKEDKFLEKLKKDLKKRGFYWKKLKDESTTGLPDGFLAKNGKGMFFEGKLLIRRYLPETIKDRYKFTPGYRKVQLMTMVEMDQHFFARYIIGIYVRGKLYVALVPAPSVFRLIQYGDPFDIKPYPYEDFLVQLERIMEYG